MGNSSSQEEDGYRRPSDTPQRPKRNSVSSASKSDDKVPTVTQNFDSNNDDSKEINKQPQPNPPTATTSTSTTAARPQNIPVKRPSDNVVHEEFVEHVESATPPPPQLNPAAAKKAASTGPERPKFPRRKSAIVLETEDETDQMQKLNLDTSTEENTPVQTSITRMLDETSEQDPEKESEKFDTTIRWIQPSNSKNYTGKVYVTGTFTGWRKMIRLNRQEDGNFAVVVKLPAGTHRFKFIVNNEMVCSDFIETATDSMGNLMNYVVVPQSESATGAMPDVSSQEQHYEEYKDDDMTKPETQLEYCREIPEVFTNPEVMDRFVSSEYVTPPQLPPHLEGVILNSNSTEKDNNSVLPVPNHVVLNHLATTSIKHNVLAVASISRYSRKYVTQVLYAPL